MIKWYHPYLIPGHRAIQWPLKMDYQDEYQYNLNFYIGSRNFSVTLDDPNEDGNIGDLLDIEKMNPFTYRGAVKIIFENTYGIGA